MQNAKRIVFLTKEPIREARVRALEALLSVPSIEITGIFIESVMHLPFWEYLFLTIKRIKRGHIYLPEFIKQFFSYILPIPFQKENESNIDEFSRRNNIPLHRVKNIESGETRALISKLKPDLGIIYGHRILKEDLFGIPKEGSINVHYGILPRYASSNYATFWALTEKAREVGLTIHKVDGKVDHGEILFIQTVPVRDKGAAILNKEIEEVTPVALKEAVTGLIQGRLAFYEQDDRLRKYWKPPTFFERIKYRRYL